MIKDIKELNFPKREGEDKSYATLSHATVSIADMAEKSITTQVKIDGDITPDFSKDWEVEFQGEKYIMPLRQPQGAKENTSLNSTIDLTFQHWAIYQLKRWMFFTVQPVEAGTAVPDKYIASVQLNLRDFVNLFSQVLQYYYGSSITISLYSGWEGKEEPVFIDINHSYIWDVLIKFYELFAVRWQIEPSLTNSNTDEGGERYVIKVGYPTTEVNHIFEYGFEGGLLKVERQVQSDEIRNMLLGRGGDKNIPKFYFKKSDDEELFRSDPDWVPELANIYFDRLRGKTFRDYIRGWKTNPNRQKTYKDKDGKTHALSVEMYDGPYGESNWAYKLGHEDAKFNPVEYVKDDESIAKYGPLLGGLDDNDEIYPSIQGSGMDVAIAVDQVTSDDVEGKVESDAQTSNLSNLDLVAYSVPHNERWTIAKRGFDFEVPQGMMANFDHGSYNVSAVYQGKKIIGITFFAEELGGEDIVIESITANIYNKETGEKRSASGILSGHYYYELVVELQNDDRKERTLDITVSFPNSTYTFVDEQKNKFLNTFDIWVQNIWETTKLSSETDVQYAERVWKPILGDREQNTAKVMFTTGALAISEDYEFTIVSTPEYDTSKSYTDADGETHASHWRIKLAKSDADLESTGLYVPSTKRQGKAGDKFVFIGTEMTHHYVLWAEGLLDDAKTDSLREVKDIKPTWVVTTDRVRLNNEGKSNGLIRQLKAGHSLRLADRRFIPVGEGKAYETLYLQSLTYTYREPSGEDAALNPDVEIVLSNDYATTANPVATIQGEISAIQRQLGSISNIEQIVRAVGDKLYLRKDGIPDRSLSPTQFFSLLTSGDFRNGIVGGRGWGFFKDENDNWVLEADRVNARQEIQANTLVINQAEGRGGMEIDTAALMEVIRVVDTPQGYVCYFDQKEGSVANLFHVDDVAFCNRWTPENTELKFYKRRVVAVAADSITLSKTDVNGSGIPVVGDNIIHFGNYTDKTRQYVKVRDVVGGGYERFLDNLDSVNATGTEYYFVGRQAGMYNNRPRWYIGDDNGYIEWVNGVLNIKGRINMLSTINNKPIQDYVNDAAQNAADAVKDELQANIDILQNQVDGVVEAWSFAYTPTNSNYPASEWDDEGKKQAHVGDVFYNIQPAFNANGTTNPDAGKAWRWSPADSEHAGYHWHPIADSDAVKALQLAQMSVKDTDVLYISHTSATEAPPLPVVDANGVITDAKGWTTTAPQWQKDRYIWQTTYVRKGNGSASFSDPTCIQGAKGADGSDGASYASNIFPSKYFNLSDEGARLTKAGNLTQASIMGNNTVARFYLVPAYSPIRAKGYFSISMWGRVTAGTISLLASINDCWLMPFTEIDTSWKRLTGTVYVGKYIGQHGFIDFLIRGTGDIANVRISDVVITPTDKPIENWVPTADEMTGTPAKSVRITGNQVFNYEDDFATLVGPSSITLTATLQGTTGYLWQYSTNGGNSWTTFKYPDGQTLSLFPNGDIFPGNSRSAIVRCTSGGVYDEMTIYKVSSGSNGTDGTNGKDAYTVILTNESHIFEGDTEKAIAASTVCDVIAYKGTTRVPSTIGTIGGAVAGMTTTITNNGTTSAKFTVNVTATMTAKQGVLNIPVTVDGNIFNKTFSWSLSLEGKSARSITVRSSGYSGSVVGGHGYVKVDGVNIFSTPLRGLTIVTIDRTTLNMSGSYRYDLWEGNTNVATARTDFINKIDSLTDDVFACILYRDNVTWTADMVEAMKKLGSLGNIRTDGVYRTFAFIGYKGLTPGYALQAQGDNGATPPVEVSTYVANGMFATSPTQVGIKSITEQYYLSTSITTPTGGSWSDTKQPWDPDKVYWTRSKITYTDGSIEYVGEICADVYVYSIGSTADNITKDASGNLSASSFTVTKYVSSSTSPLSATKRNVLKYVRTTSFGPQAETLVSGHGASTGYTVNIGDDDRAFVFNLYDDKNNLLSRKRIPVIDSTTGLEVGTNNYALNTATEKTIIFKNDASWQVDELYTVKDIQVGDTLILGFSYSLSVSGGESGAYLDVYMDFGHGTLEIEPDIDNILGIATLGFVNFVSKPVKVTKTHIGQSNGVGVIKLGHKYITGGLLTIRELCLQKGNVYTGWNRSSFDFDYLTEALKEQGSFEGGLILASLMKLGYTAKDGYKTLSGLNGIYSDIKKGGGLAFWAGGDQIDAQEDSVNGATSGIRMDGTAYFARNTIRFKENTIEIGNNIVLDKDALSMFSSNAECVRISNTAVSLSESDITNSSPYSISGTIPLGSIAIYKIDEERYTISSSEKYFGGSYTATKKCTLRLSFAGNISSTSVTSSKKLMGRMQVLIYKGTTVYQTLTQELRPIVSSITNSLSINYVFSAPLPSAGVYKFSVKFTPSISSDEQEEVGYAVNNNLTITGKITPEMSSKTLLGNNGLLSIWNNAGMCINSNSFIAMVGKYGIRITSSGIQIMKNGTWSSL